MGRRATLSVLFVIFTTIHLTSVEDVYKRHEGGCDWVCEISDLNFGEELKNLKGKGRLVKAQVQYHQQRVAKLKGNNSSDILTEVWMTLWTADNAILQSRGFVQLVNKTVTLISLSGQFISWRYKKLNIYCIKPSTNLLLNYSRGLNESACAGHQRPILSLHARDSSNYTNLISFFGCLWTDKNSRIFVGFYKQRNNNGFVNSDRDQQSEGWNSYDFAFYLIRISLTFLNPAMLALFCLTDITVPVRRVQAHDGSTEKDGCQPETKSSQIEVLSLEDETIRDSSMGQQNRQEDDNENLIDDENDTLLNGTNREEERMTVRLINVDGLNPKCFRSFIADNVFSNTGNRSKCRKTLKLVILVLFPLSVPFLVDLYFLPMPRVFSKIASHLPSRFLTTSVLYFAYEKCPYMFIMFFSFYFIRCLCLCFTPATSIWAPSFVCRKHLKCAIYNNYCVKNASSCFPRCRTFSFLACDECKTTADCPKHCEVPENINHNLQVSKQIFVRHWNYVYGHLFNKYCMQIKEEQDGFLQLVKVIFLLLVVNILVGVYVFLVFIDLVFSSPIISLCYGRMWVTGEWLEHNHQLHFRIIRFVCHFLEFLFICCSVVWVTYFSFYTSSVIEITIRGFQKSLVSNFVETVKYLIITTVFLHSSLSYYKSFIRKYEDLTLELFKSYKESYKQHNANDKLINYQQGDILTIPKDLFDKACKKHMPLNVKKITCNVVFLSIFWSIFFPIFNQIETSTVGLNSYVLTAICGFISWAHPWIIDYIWSKKKTEKVVLKEVATNVVEDYITDLTRG